MRKDSNLSERHITTQIGDTTIGGEIIDIDVKNVKAVKTSKTHIGKFAIYLNPTNYRQLSILYFSGISPAEL